MTTVQGQAPVAPLPPPAEQKLPPGISWTLTLTAAPFASPVIAGDKVLVSMLPGVVAAHALADGRELWRATLSLEQPLVVDGERVIVAAAGAVEAISVHDRAPSWRTATGAVTAPLLVKDGWVIAATATHTFALRAADGTVVWQRENGIQRSRGAISGDALFLPLSNGRVQALDLATGVTRWERPLGGSPAEPLVVGDRLYVGATDKTFYAIRTASGEIDWPIRVGAAVRSTASTDGERVVFAGLDNLVRAVGRSSGAQRWQTGVRFRPFAGPLVLGGAVYVAGPSKEIRMLDVATGRDLGKVTFPEALAIAPALGESEGTVIAAGITGGLTEPWKLWLWRGSPPPGGP